MTVEIKQLFKSEKVLANMSCEVWPEWSTDLTKGSPRRFEATAVTSKAMRTHAPGSKALSNTIAST